MGRLLLALSFLLALSVQANAEELIETFISEATVNADASLTVRETITVKSEGYGIKRGILRDFPTSYYGRRGQRVRVGFEVLEVKRNGEAEPFAIESLSNGKRIRIGDSGVYLPYGSHSYEIAYRTTRQLGFFENFDELYWNVTGNGWTFPIEEASVIIHLPPGARIQQHAEYTGPQGSTANSSQVITASGSDYRAVTVRRLEAGEGFTVAVAWQKGIVTQPSGGDQFSWWLRDNAGLFALLTTLLASGLFYIYAWNKAGRDPPRGIIIPLFAPPDNISPAAARFVWKQGFDDRAFAAALVGLAVKGRLKIADNESEYEIEKIPGDASSLTAAERRLFASLPEGTTELKQANHATVRPMRAALAKALKDEYEGKVFLRNLGWFWMGAVISIAGLAISALLLPGEEGMAALFAVGWSAIWWGVVLSVAWGALKGARQARGIFKKLGSLMTMLFLIPFMGAGVGVPVTILFSEGSAGLYMVLGAACLLGIMNMVFFHLLRAPTVPGRKLLDRLEGFRMYMTTAEEERLNILNPPEKTPELFERYLPYALALDCENAWNTKFAAVLAAAAAAGATAPLWYSGSHWDSGRTGSFTESLGSSLSSSISSASTAPGSRSGSGGGSSGGGGGGGGGSGW
ncbi:MAG: DUF2207 domain-containing protein [Rhizobiales bacterium]|nr:DUF2207 domain-containing protein [Hyphomicrobiales bacterium]